MMPSSKSTIFFLAALAIVGPVAMSQPANALQAMGPPPVRRAEHIQLARKMIRKRSAPPRVVPIRRQDTPPEQDPGAGAPTSPPPSGINILDPVPTVSSVASSPTPDPNSRPATTTQQQQSTSTPTSAPSSSSTSIQSSSSSTSTRPSTTSASTSSSSTQQASVVSNTSITPTSTPQDTAIQVSSTPNTSRSTLLITTTSIAPSAPEESDKSKDEGASFLPKPVLVGLIVAAAGVVGAVVIWTIIRKWKFGASRQFEDRLEPINWEPSATSDRPMDEHNPATVAIARGNSVTSQRGRTSFGSSDGTHAGAAGGRNMADSVAPDFPPAHDFTPGPSHLAPGAGYADLQRGPSPAPSMNYSAYGQQYTTPNPYDTYDYPGAYGAYAGAQQPPHNSGPGPHQF